MEKNKIYEKVLSEVLDTLREKKIIDSYEWSFWNDNNSLEILDIYKDNKIYSFSYDIKNFKDIEKIFKNF